MLLHMIQEPPWRGDDDIDPRRRAAICGLMPTPPKTTVELTGTYFAVGAHAFFDLHRQFPGGNQDQHPRRAGDAAQAVAISSDQPRCRMAG